MRSAPLLAALVLILPDVALAHLGHLGEVAGHDHWLAGAALGAAVVVGVWGVLKGRRKEEPAPEPDTEAEAETDTTDVPA